MRRPTGLAKREADACDCKAGYRAVLTQESAIITVKEFAHAEDCPLDRCARDAFPFDPNTIDQRL